MFDKILMIGGTSMNKKVIIFIVITLVVIGLGVGAFFIVDHFVYGEKEVISSSNKINEKEDYVYNLKTENLGREHVCLEGGVYFALPKINLNNEAVKRYNKNLEDRYNNQLEEYKFDSEQCWALYKDFSFEYHLNGDILSFILKETINGGTHTYSSYEVKNYDVKLNRELRPSDILAHKNISLEVFEDKLYNAISAHYNKNTYIYHCDPDSECNEDQLNLDLTKTVTSIDYNRMSIFMDSKGILSIIVKVYTTMGHDDYYPTILEIT